jgi:flagellar motor protein MotB
MKVTRVLSTAIVCLLPGAIATAYAQEHEQAKQPAAHEQQAKPAQHQQQAKPAKQQAARPQQAKPAKQQAARPQQAKPAKQQATHQQQAKPAKQQATHQQQAKPAKQQAERGQRAKPAQQSQRGQQAHAGRGQSAGGHGSIPEAKFRSSFGSGHTFHVNRSEFANGSGRFQYGGYWFNVVDPWPVGWLYTDNVYVDYLNGGYFLCDPVHPGVYISINIG